MNSRRTVMALAIGAMISTPALATNGYFSHGYGIKAQGIGGVGIALPQDAIAAATNPAGMAAIGDRFDAGISLFRPDRGATLSNTAGGSGMLDGEFDGNNKDLFVIPELGYNRMLSDAISLGVSVYGNGGMNTDYEQPIALLSGASGNESGIDYMQLFVAPTMTWQFLPGQTLGVALDLGYQRFKAKGIDNFTFISIDPASVTGQGADDAFGLGIHLGWTGKLSDEVTLGATWQSRASFGEFDKYRGLFAGEGNMDKPASFGVGIAIDLTPDWTVAADVQRILFSEVESIGNPIAAWNGQPFVSGGAGNLGDEAGPGFGWEDVTVYKLGVSYRSSETLTLRAGYDHSGQPVPESETLFNILAPGIVQDHLSLGATWTLSGGSEVSVAYTHAFEETVDGTNTIPAAFGGGDVSLRMHQDMIGISWGWSLR